MKAFRRSLSPFRRRRNADDLIQEIKLKEEEHMKRSMIIKSEARVESRSSTRNRTSSRLNTAEKNDSVPEMRGRSLSRGGSWFQRNKTEPKLMALTNRDFGFTNEPTDSKKRDRRRHSFTTLPPTPAMIRSRSSSIDRSLPTIRQVSLADHAVVDVTTALRQMETQISTARRQGKRVSRAKVMGALLSVVDQLDAEQNKLGPQESKGLLEVTIKTSGNMSGDHFSQVTDDESVNSYNSSSVGTNQSRQTDDDEDDDDDFDGSTSTSGNSMDDQHSRRKSTPSFPSVTNLLWGGGSKEQPISPQTNSSVTVDRSSSYTDHFYSSVGMSPTTPPDVNTTDRSTKRVTFKSSNQLISPTLEMDTAPPLVRVRSLPKKPLFGFASPRRQSKELVEPARLSTNTEESKAVKSKEGSTVSISGPNHPHQPTTGSQPKPRSSSLSTKARFKAAKVPESNSWFAMPDIDAVDLQKALADIFLIGDDPKVADSKVPRVKMNQRPRKTGSMKASSERPATKVRKNPVPTPQRKEPKNSSEILTFKKLSVIENPVQPGNVSVESTPSRVASSQSNSPNREQLDTTKPCQVKQPLRKTELEPSILPTRIVIDTSRQQNFDDGFPDDEGVLSSNSFSRQRPQANTMSSKPKKAYPY